jgi:hypothetical protein
MGKNMFVLISVTKFPASHFTVFNERMIGEG